MKIEHVLGAAGAIVGAIIIAVLIVKYAKKASHGK